MIKTFRSLLKSDGQDRIRLSTIKGKVGYKIIKCELLPQNFGASDYEAVVQIWKTEQTTPTNVIDFSDSDLLGAATWSSNSNVTTEVSGFNVMFDNEIFNQDIYVTMKDTQSGRINYYIELEVIPLNDAGAEYTTLKDMRSS